MSDTDYTQAVKLENLSPTWVREFDKQYGAAKAENGGYVEFHIRFEGQARPRWWERLTRFLSCKLK